jgi:hypothetical protein
MFIPDSDLDFYLSRIQGSKRRRILNTVKNFKINASFCIQVELFTLTGGGELKADYSLRAHTRVLTDLDWHTHNPDLLVTR